MKISTITLSGKLDRIIINSGLTDRSRIGSGNKFYNSTTITLSQGNLKIFKNGAFVITGFKDPSKLNELIDEVNKLTSMNITDMKICMIRVYDTFSNEINLKKMYEELKNESKQWNSVVYDPERFSGVILKNQFGTAIIFRTGKYSLIVNSFDSLNNLKNCL